MVTKLLVIICYSFLNARSTRFFFPAVFDVSGMPGCLVKSCIFSDVKVRVLRPDLPLAAVQAAECLAVLGAVARLDCILSGTCDMAISRKN